MPTGTEFLTAVWRDAKAETYRYMQAHLFGEITATIVAAVTGYLISPDSKLLTALAVGVATGLILMVIVFVWKFLSAPSRLFGQESSKYEAAQKEITALRERLRPKLLISFEPKDPWVKWLPYSQMRDHKQPGSPLVQAPSGWFRICIQCAGSAIAHGCRVFLQNVEYAAFNTSNFEQTEYGNSQPLRWAEDQITPYAPREISPLQKSFVDVASVDPVHNVVHVKWPSEWIANEHLFDRPGEYRLTICASSEDAGSRVAQCILRWTGKWDETELRLEGA